MKIKPRKDNVLVEPIDVGEMNKGGIIIPDSAKEKSKEGKVIAVGPGKTNDNGDLIPVDLKVGAVVLLPMYGGAEISHAGKTYQLISEDQISATIG